MKYLSLLLFLLLLKNSTAQPHPDKSYFRNPLNITPSLAGNFGALRANHYHMGLDFRTGGQENLTVVAAAAGYVSHIRIEPYGYGRAIFITHPNGLTTVYAHLNTFFPDLEYYVRNRQYATQSWQQDIDFSPGQFPVGKGQFIALSGNTGGSEGPHLHFEIRDSGLAQGHNHNPMLWGLGIADAVPPVLNTLALFSRAGSIYENSPQTFRLQKRSAGGETFFSPTSPVIKVPYGRFSLGLNMEDKTNNSFLFGVYRASLYVDDSLHSLLTLSECIYEDSRYINAGIDYYTRYSGGPYLQHLSRLPGDRSPFLKGIENDSILQLTDDSVHQVEIEVSDVAGNLSLLRLGIQRDSNVAFVANFGGPIAQKLAPGQTEIFENNDVQVVLDEAALYDTVLLRYGMAQTADSRLSNSYAIGDYRVPVQDSFTVRIKPKPYLRTLPDSIKNKTLMLLHSGGKADAQLCTWQGPWAEAKWWNFGDFVLVYDNEKPSIRPVNVYDSATFIKDQKLVFDATDALTDLQSFNGYIDGQWVIFRQKNDRYTYDFDDRCPPGWHTIQIKAVDKAGNEARYECRFFNGAKE